MEKYNNINNNNNNFVSSTKSPKDFLKFRILFAYAELIDVKQRLDERRIFNKKTVAEKLVAKYKSYLFKLWYLIKMSYQKEYDSTKQNKILKEMVSPNEIENKINSKNSEDDVFNIINSFLYEKGLNEWDDQYGSKNPRSRAVLYNEEKGF